MRMNAYGSQFVGASERVEAKPADLEASILFEVRKEKLQHSID
jgi:hypothetical protein